MKILAVEDEDIARRRLIGKLGDAVQNAEITAFGTAKEAIEYIKTNDVDIAFLDIELGSISGVEVAKEIKRVHPQCNIVFCTGYSEYMADAFSLAASDYILKPVTTEKILHALENLRHPLTLRIPDDKLYVRCFGEFEVYLKGEPLMNLKNKSKELFAFLVDRKGAMCSPSEVSEYLWEDCSDVNFRKRSKDLVTLMEEIGQGDVIIKGWGKIGIAQEKIVCDYYEYLKGTPESVNLYNGQYMTQYAWAVDTAEELK